MAKLRILQKQERLELLEKQKNYSKIVIQDHAPKVSESLKIELL